MLPAGKLPDDGQTGVRAAASAAAYSALQEAAFVSQLQPYLISLGVGLGVGVAYGLVSVRSPAPPIIALLGLLGMLAGEAGIQSLKGHANFVQACLHEKSFALHSSDEVTKDRKA
jgi:XapX domain-containing protein